MNKIGYSEPQELGMIEKIEDVQVTERAMLLAGGLEIDALHTKLLAQHKKTNASNEKQENYKRLLKAATEEHVEDLKQLYVMGSSQLDMMIGAVDKNSVAAKNFRRIRSKITMPDETAGTENGPAISPTPVKP